MGKPDIVVRLRDDYQKTVELCAEAADEIERLREKLNGGKCKHPRATYDSSGAHCPDCGGHGTFPGMG